jgi:hypothetical protein
LDLSRSDCGSRPQVIQARLAPLKIITASRNTDRLTPMGLSFTIAIRRPEKGAFCHAMRYGRIKPELSRTNQAKRARSRK